MSIKGAPMRLLAVVASLFILPLSILAQEEEEKKKGFSVTGVPLID